MTSTDASYFIREGGRTFASTPKAGGAWATDEQHISPVNGLVVHQIERFVAARFPDDGMQIARISFDILGVLPLAGSFTIDVEVIRAGRTIQLLEATVASRGRSAMLARVWRMKVADTATVAGGANRQLRGPDDLAPADLTAIWPGEFIDSVEFRPTFGPQEGRAAGWLRSRTALLLGEPVGSLAAYVALVDTANGIAVRRPPDTWLYPNLDLTIHLFRQPEGAWVGLDTTVTFGATGSGLTSTVLHDRDGQVGSAAQTLTLRARD